jgi:branched-chain amino acid transport system ATP-binding protein
VAELLAAFDLEDVAERTVSEIPQDKRKLAAIARALATDPAMVLMDEPAAGLNTDETAALGEQLRRMARGGLGILLVEHDMELVLSVCHRILVLDFGRAIAEGKPEEIVKDERVVGAYLGSGATA